MTYSAPSPARKMRGGEEEERRRGEERRKGGGGEGRQHVKSSCVNRQPPVSGH